MKKRVLFGLAGLMLVSALTGCGGEKKSKYLKDVDYFKYIELGNYKGIEVEDVEYKVTDEEVEGTIEDTLIDYTENKEIKDRDTIEMGDVVAIDFVGKLDGKESEDYSGQEDVTVGEEFFYPEVEEQLLKQKVGDTFDCKVKLTEDFLEEDDPDLGKEVELKVTVNGIFEEVVPELDEDFVKENTDYKTVEEYKKSVKKELEDGKKEEYRANAVSQIIDKIVENSKFDGYPQEIYDMCEENFNASNEAYAAQFGMDTDSLLEMMGMDEAACKEAIEEDVKYELVFGAIAIKEGVDCSEKEIDDYVKKNYDAYGYESEKDFLDDYGKEEVAYYVLYEKVCDILYDLAKKNTISEEEYLKRLEEEEAELEEGEDVEEVYMDEEDEELDDKAIEEIEGEADSQEDNAKDEVTSEEATKKDDAASIEKKEEASETVEKEEATSTETTEQKAE